MSFRYLQTGIVLFLSLLFLGSAKLLNMNQPPAGHTGATPGVNCATSCHTGNPLNAPGGSVGVNGLPANYTPGTVYPFTLSINHGAANRLRWGFSIRAVGTANNDVGTFSTISPSNAGVNGTELSHLNAPFTPASNTFTFNNLRWTAPASPTPQEQTVTFYFVGNAANGDNNNTGDFIYTASRVSVLTPTSVNEQLPGVQQWKAFNHPLASNIMVRYSLKESTVIGFTVYDVTGKQLAAIQEKRLPAGEHQQLIEIGRLQSGIYTVEMRSGRNRTSQKVFVH